MGIIKFSCKLSPTVIFSIAAAAEAVVVNFELIYQQVTISCEGKTFP